MLNSHDLDALRAEHSLLDAHTQRDPDAFGANPTLAARGITWDRLREDDPAVYDLLSEWHLNLVHARTEDQATPQSRSRWLQAARLAFAQLEAVIKSREETP